MKPCKIFFLLFLTIVTHNSIFAVKWKWKYGWWNEKNLEDVTELLQKLQPLLKNKPFAEAIGSRLSFAKAETLFENVNNNIEQFIMVSQQEISSDKRDMLTEFLRQIVNPLMSCKDTIENSSAKLFSTEEIVVEIKEESGGTKLAVQPFLKFWEPYEIIINKLNWHYEKAIAPTSGCAVS